MEYGIYITSNNNNGRMITTDDPLAWAMEQTDALRTVWTSKEDVMEAWDLDSPVRSKILMIIEKEGVAVECRDHYGDTEVYSLEDAPSEFEFYFEAATEDFKSAEIYKRLFDQKDIVLQGGSPCTTLNLK